jgi:hypothetical protein
VYHSTLFSSQTSVLTSSSIQKLKHNQTFTALNKSKDVFKLLSNQLQRQNEMQLEVIRQYNEHEKNINAQLVSQRLSQTDLLCVLFLTWVITIEQL